MSTGSERPSAIAIAVAGCVALAVAMGIGRFAFTPILPMMLHDGVVDLHAASWLASANYLGYLSGALLCTFVPLLWSRLPGSKPIDGPALVRAGLAGTGVLTLATSTRVLTYLVTCLALPVLRRRREVTAPLFELRAGVPIAVTCAAVLSFLLFRSSWTELATLVGVSAAGLLPWWLFGSHVPIDGARVDGAPRS